METESPLAKALWVASQTVNRPAWELLGQTEPTEAWLTWTLVMANTYPVGSLKFERPADTEAKTAFQISAVGWDNVLCGKALSKFRGKFIVPGLAEYTKQAKLIDARYRKLS
jgi:hypothetical protein